jgi:adenylate kinase
VDKIVVCVFGVNGSGKTALLQAVSDLLPGVVIFRGSTILKESLGVASYETLEAMSSEEKKSALINGISVSVRNAPDRIILVDTHLIVPIRKLGALIIEDMWDDSMSELFHGFVYVTAPSSTVSERRKSSEERVLRKAHSTAQMCAEDLQSNALRWDEISVQFSHKKVIVNDQSILVGAEKIIDFIRMLAD